MNENILLELLLMHSMIVALGILMTRGKFIILFVIRSYKQNDKNKKAPINLRIKYNTVVASDLSCFIYVEPNKWDSAKQRIKGNSTEAQQMNDHLDQIKQEVYDIYLYLRRTKQEVTAHKVRNLYQGTQLEVKECYKKFDKERSKSKNEDTARAYENHQKLFLEFIQYASIPQIKISNFSKNDGLKYRKFLLEVKKTKANKKLSQNYASKAFSSLILMFDYAVEKSYRENNPIKELGIPRQQKVEIIYLSKEELAKIENFKFASLGLQKTADLFLFQCYTGIAYKELSQLEAKNLVYSSKYKRYVLKVKREKTKKFNSESILPLLNKPQAIIEKYGGIENLSRIVPDNRVYNRSLKQIQFMVGIDKKITTHVGRSTFANFALNDWGVRIEVVSKMLGHKNIKTTLDHYARIIPESIMQAMKNIE